MQAIKHLTLSQSKMNFYFHPDCNDGLVRVKILLIALKE
jgi:hypothetical protein